MPLGLGSANKSTMEYLPPSSLDDGKFGLYKMIGQQNYTAENKPNMKGYNQRMEIEQERSENSNIKNARTVSFFPFLFSFKYWCTSQQKR